MADADTHIDRMLADAAHDPAVAQKLLEILYAELRAVAQQRMAAERAGHTLSATALVHEAFIRLVGPRDVPWNGRTHFYAAAVEAMHRVLVDHARSRGRQKRGGGRVRVDLEAAAMLAANEQESADFVALHEAISRLHDVDARSAEVVRLRYYAGLTNSEAAAVLGVSKRTVNDDWAFAKAWLARELK
jgi:RNA polymerase sigma factor (TIGR02999 family)